MTQTKTTKTDNSNYQKTDNSKTGKKYMLRTMIRSSHPEVFCKERVLKYFTKFIVKHPCQSLFFIKVADLN